MRRIIPIVLVAAAALMATPASASYLVNGCGSGDYRVVEVTAAGREIVEVCTDRPPILISCDICSKISI